MLLVISIVKVRGEDSEEVWVIPSLFSSMTKRGLALISLVEGISAPVVSVVR